MANFETLKDKAKTVEWVGVAALCVLGAGNCNDLDLRRLSSLFDEVHLVDLGIGVTYRDWPADFVAAWLPRLRAHWVKPEVVVQVAFTEWTVHGKLRHSRLLRVMP